MISFIIMRKSLLYTVVAVMTFVACSTKQEKTEDTEEEIITKKYEAVGDSMLYGLACDGCSDSVLVLLPDSGGDPVNYDIVDAMRNRRVFGMPGIGDKMAVLVDTADQKKLVMAVNLELVNGTWYYLQLPEVRRPSHMADDEMTEGDGDVERMDSMVNRLMIPKEYVYTLKRDYTVKTEGGPPRVSSLDAESPVVYPAMRRYREWHVFNGKLIFTYGGVGVVGKDSIALKNDTAEFILLRPDTMVLRFPHHVIGFKLRPDTASQKGRIQLK